MLKYSPSSSQVTPYPSLSDLFRSFRIFSNPSRSCRIFSDPLRSFHIFSIILDRFDPFGSLLESSWSPSYPFWSPLELFSSLLEPERSSWSPLGAPLGSSWRFGLPLPTLFGPRGVLSDPLWSAQETLLAPKRHPRSQVVRHHSPDFKVFIVVSAICNKRHFFHWVKPRRGADWFSGGPETCTWRPGGLAGDPREC